MPANDLHYDAVVTALVADGWPITHDPLTLRIGDRELYVDLAAERKGEFTEEIAVRIAVEIQSLLKQSEVSDLHTALGQYSNYRTVLIRQQPDRPLYLAITRETFDGIFSEPLGQLARSDLNVLLLVFDSHEKKVISWKS